MKSKKISKFNLLILSAVLIFSGFNFVLADDKPSKCATDHCSYEYEIENNSFNNQQNAYIPSEEECAVTEIINNIEDDTKREMIYQFWVTPAFGISGEAMNDPKVRETTNSNLIENYTYLASLPISELKGEFERINESTYQYLKSVPNLEVEKLSNI